MEDWLIIKFSYNWTQTNTVLFYFILKHWIDLWNLQYNFSFCKRLYHSNYGYALIEVLRENCSITFLNKTEVKALTSRRIKYLRVLNSVTPSHFNKPLRKKEVRSGYTWKANEYPLSEEPNDWMRHQSSKAQYCFVSSTHTKQKLYLMQWVDFYLKKRV